MHKAIGPALLAVGILMIVLGIGAAESLGSEAKQFFTGTPSDQSIWLLLGGVAATVTGLFKTLRRA